MPIDNRPEQPALPPAQRRSGAVKRVRVAAAATVVLLGLAFAGITIMGGQMQEPALTQAQTLARSAAFAAAGKLSFPVVKPAETAEALVSMGLPDIERAKLREDVERKRVELIWLTLWDDRDEDGDVVEIRSSGFSQHVTLKNGPIRLAIPAPLEGIVNLRGIADGGGGITVAVKSGNSVVLIPVMSVGQTLGIPVAP